MRRWLVWGLVVLLLVILAIPTGLYFVARSESGSRLLLSWAVERSPVELVFTEVRGNLLRGLVFTDFQLGLGDTEISADQVDLAWQPQLLLAGTLHLDHLNIDNLNVRVEDRPEAQGDATSLPWPTLSLPLRLTIDNLNLDGVTFQQNSLLDRLQFAGSLTGSSLQIDRFDLQRGTSRLQLQGQLRLAGRYPLSLEAAWNHAMAGQGWSGAGELEGNLGALRINHSLTAPYSIDSELLLTQQLPESPAELSIQNLTLEGTHSAAQLDVRDLLGDWAIFNQVELVTLGTVAAVDLQLDLAADLPWLAASQVHAEGTFQPNRLSLQELRLDTSRGLVQTGVEYLLDEQQISLDPLVLQDFELGGPLNPLQAEARASVDLSPELSVEGELLSATIDQQGTTISASGLFAYRDGQLSGQDLILLSGANRLSLSGGLFPELAADWQIQAPELGTLLGAIQNLDDPVIGLQGSGRLQGSYDQPRVTASLEASRLGLLGFSADRVGLEVNPRGGLHDLQLEIPEAAFRGREIRQLSASGTFSRQQIALELQTMVDNLALEVDGEAAQSDGLWQLSLEQLDLFGPPAVGDWALDNTWRVQQSAEGWQAEQVCWSSQDASLCAEAGTSAERTRVDVQLDNLPMDFLQYLVSVPLRVDGRMAGSLHWLQEGDSGDLELNLDSAEGSILVPGQERAPDPVSYRQLQVSATMSGQLMQAQASVELGESGRAEASGTLDFSPEQPELDSELLLDIGSLEWIEGVVTQVDRVRGNLDLRLQVQGPMGNPAINLTADLADGSLMIPQAGVELAELELSVRPTPGNSMDIRARAVSGEGAVQLQGELEAPALDDMSARASIAGENFQVLDRSDLRLRVSPDLELELVPGQVSVRGRLDIPQAQARVRALPAGGVRPSGDEVIVGDASREPEEYLDLVMDLEIVLGEEVNLQGFGLSTGLTGSLEIQQPPGEQRRTFGTIELRDGQYQAYGRTLVVQRGRMIFQGEIENPGLDVDAEQSYPDYTVGVHLGGTALNPTTTLYSEPAMSQSDILAVLITGQRLDTMSASEAPTLLSAATQLGLVGGSAIAERIEENFGLSEFGVRDDGQNGQSIVAGTYLLPRLYVEWAQGIFEPSSSVQLEYRISDQWKLKARSGTSQSMDLIYEIETE